MIQDLLKSKNVFKLICGAGKEDCEEVKRLVYLYSLCGVKFFDLCANSDVILAAKSALNLAEVKDAYLCASLGIKNDPHSNKAVIDYDKCINCASCESVCQENAIKYVKVKSQKCVGCGRCLQVCPKQAISFRSEYKEIEQILPPVVASGIDCLEFHIIGQDEEEILSKWNYINANFDGILSICISRGKIGDESVIEILTKMLKIRKPYTTIIQADGFPLSGGKDDFKTTLQAVAMAEIIQNAKLPAYLLLSGGTNSKTAQLAKLCGIDYDGISVGSYARKIVRDLICRPDFWTNQNVIDSAISIITPLVKSVLE